MLLLRKDGWLKCEKTNQQEERKFYSGYGITIQVLRSGVSGFQLQDSEIWFKKQCN